MAASDKDHPRVREARVAGAGAGPRDVAVLDRVPSASTQAAPDLAAIRAAIQRLNDLPPEERQMLAAQVDQLRAGLPQPTGSGALPALPGQMPAGRLAVLPDRSGPSGPPAVPPPAAPAGPPEGDIPETPMRFARGAASLGVIVAILFFGVFVTWASVAPLKRAAHAQGVVTVVEQRQTVNHREGGVISEINVREGDFVKAGDVLMQLQDEAVTSSADALRIQLMQAEAERARLAAEAAGQTQIDFPEATFQQIIDSAQSAQERENLIRERDAAVANQSEIISSRRDYVGTQTDISLDQERQRLSEIDALNAQNVSIRNQMALLRDEIRAVQILVDRGLETQRRLRSLERELEELDGRIKQNLANITRAEQQISETRLRVINLENQLRNEVVEARRTVDEKIAELTGRLQGTIDAVRRLTVVAPVDGQVINLQYHTLGSVVRPGEPILEIVPSNTDLLIEARVSPEDREIIYVGMISQVTLTAFTGVNLSPIDGEVIQVNEDTSTDARGEFVFYKALIRIPAEQWTRLREEIPENRVIVKGMNADVTLVAGERTLAMYLIEPLWNSWKKAFIDA